VVEPRHRDRPIRPPANVALRRAGTVSAGWTSSANAEPPAPMTNTSPDEPVSVLSTMRIPTVNSDLAQELVDHRTRARRTRRASASGGLIR